MPVVSSLIVAGVVVRVKADNASRDIRAQGALVDTMDGGLRSSIDPLSVRDEWAFETIPMTFADLATLKAAAPHGKLAACSGRLLGPDGVASPAAPVSCYVLYGRAVPVKVWPTGIQWVQPFTLREK